MKSVFSHLFVASLSLVGATAAWACIHFPIASPKFVEGTQKVLLFHDGVFAHMIVSTDLRGNPLPTEVAWVIPVETVPTAYSEIPVEIFTELHALWPKPRSLKGVDSPSVSTNGGITLYKAENTRNYSIQPIGISNSANEFNAWLKSNRYNEMPMELQKAYLKKGAVFLAIRMKTAGKTYNDLNPIHIVYKSKELTYPLKFTHRERKFDLSLFVLSHQKLKSYDWEKSLGLWRNDLTVNAKNYSSPKELKTWKKGEPVLPALIANTEFFVTEFSGSQLSGEILAKAPADPRFQLNELGDGLIARKISFEAAVPTVPTQAAAKSAPGPAKPAPPAAEKVPTAKSTVAASAPAANAPAAPATPEAMPVAAAPASTTPASTTPVAATPVAAAPVPSTPGLRPIARASGWVTIDSVPQADQIKIDGLVVKNGRGENQGTPLTRYSTTYGAHFVELHNSEHDSSWSSTFHIKENALTTVEGVLK